jgi:6-phosphogluconolactonase/glucosamine-6-phosphate isomerase/deaminase
MTMFEMLDSLPLLDSIPLGIEGACIGLLPGVARKKQRGGKPLLVQEQAGFYLGITPDIRATGRHAAQIAKEKYRDWLVGEGGRGDTAFKRQYFTIGVGGGNTVKNEYKALLRYYFDDINWLDHVRFFFLEETCNEENWEGTRDTLVATLIVPLAKRLIATRGARELAQRLKLKRSASRADIIGRVVEVMTLPIDASEVEAAMSKGDRELALQAAGLEARSYQQNLRRLLGPSMSLHLIISGIGRNGGIGAFPPYTPELKTKKPRVMVVENPSGAISIALNRGVLTAAECISLIVSGNLKLRALGRFEMEDSASFEQTVMETPIRMMRETYEIAEKVYIFADNRALLFDEDVFRYEENGKTIEIKSEVREGDEEGGVHILLVHGFMGLYSYINLLIRLPSAWRVSALRRGKHAKTLPDDEIFPHYANTLRKMILRNWRSKRPTPICCHSFAGSISDHLLLSVLDDYRDELPDFDQLKVEDQQLIEALRVGGVIHIATWAPSDLRHITPNMSRRKARGKRSGKKQRVPAPKEVYRLTSGGRLELDEEQRKGLVSTPAMLSRLINVPGFESTVNAVNVGIRYLASRLDLQKLMKQQEAPYGQRLLSDRVLKKVSFYGVLKEVNAALHQPEECQNRHLKALEAIVKYDIPCLAIIHREDLMVSANRHIQEHNYLIARRMAKEGAEREEDLEVPVDLLLLDRNENEPSNELIDPHFLILSVTRGGGSNARKVTAAITGFVNENTARAMAGGSIEPLASVETWRRGSKR